MKIITYKYYLLLISLSVIAVLPLFHGGLFSMHDDTQVARVYEMGKMLQAGVFPVRWVPDLGYGYGYPIFNFYAPFAYYVGGLLMLIGLNALLATKLMICIAMLFSGIGMYLLARRFWDEWGGMLAGLLYLYAPYHALNLYVRGDIAELYAYAFIPFLFWSLWRLYEKNTFTNCVLVGVFYALIIISHNLTALMISPFFFFGCGILYILKRKKEKKYSLFFLLLAPVLGILLSSFYWIPVFSEMKYTNVLSQVGGGADFRNHYACLSQLWSSPWMYGGSIPGCVDGLSFRIGKLHLMLSLVGAITSIFFVKKEKKRAVISLFGLLVLLSGVVLMLQISQPIWEAIAHMAFFQYPWRFLLLVSFASSFLSGAVIWYGKKYLYKETYISVLLFIFLIVVLLWTSIKIFIPQTYISKSSDEYTSEYALKHYASSLSDEYLPPKFDKPKKDTFVKTRFIAKKGNPQITNIYETPMTLSATATSKTASEIWVNLAYFPTWHVYINGEMKDFGVNRHGLVVYLPKGTYNISIVYKQTFIENVANVVSLLTIGVLIAIIAVPRLQKRYEK